MQGKQAEQDVRDVLERVMEPASLALKMPLESIDKDVIDVNKEGCSSLRDPWHAFSGRSHCCQLRPLSAPDVECYGTVRFSCSPTSKQRSYWDLRVDFSRDFKCTPSSTLIGHNELYMPIDAELEEEWEAFEEESEVQLPFTFLCSYNVDTEEMQLQFDGEEHFRHQEDLLNDITKRYKEAARTMYKHMQSSGWIEHACAEILQRMDCLLQDDGYDVEEEKQSIRDFLSGKEFSCLCPACQQERDCKRQKTGREDRKRVTTVDDYRLTDRPTTRMPTSAAYIVPHGTVNDTLLAILATRPCHKR